MMLEMILVKAKWKKHGYWQELYERKQVTKDACVIMDGALKMVGCTELARCSLVTGIFNVNVEIHLIIN